MNLDWGSVPDWFAAVGTISATAAAVVVAIRAAQDAGEARASVVRDRKAERLVELLRIVEVDALRTPVGWFQILDPAGRALCYSLSRELRDTEVFDLYVMGATPSDEASLGAFMAGLRYGIVQALEALDHQDSPQLD